MWRHLNVLFWGIFSSVTFQKAVPTCSSTRTNDSQCRPPTRLNLPMVTSWEFSSPSLNSNTNSVVMGQNVSLLCSHKNRSLDITYFLFLNKKFLVTKTGRGKPVTFNLTISSADDLGPYKCKATVVNCSSYSAQFNFTVIEEDSCPICPLLPLLLPGLLLVFLAIILVLAFWLQQKYKARKAMRQNVPKDSGDIPMEGDLYVNIYKTPAETCRDCNTDYTYSELTF